MLIEISIKSLAGDLLERVMSDFCESERILQEWAHTAF